MTAPTPDPAVPAASPPPVNHLPPDVSAALAKVRAFPDPVFRVRRDGTILDSWSLPTDGIPPPGFPFVGCNIGDLVAPEFLEDARKVIAAAFETREPRIFQYRNTPLGPAGLYEARVQAVNENEFVAVCRNLTTAQRFELERESLERLSRDLAGATELEAIGRALAREAYRLLEFEAFSFDLYDAADDTLTGIYCEDTPAAGTKPVPVPTLPVPQTRVRCRGIEPRAARLYAETDIQSEGELARFGFSERTSRSVILATGDRDGSRILRASVHSYTPARYGEEDAGLLGRLVREAAPVASRAITRARLRESEQRFRLAATAASNLIYDADMLADRIEYYGDVDGMLGYGPGEFDRTLAGWERIVHPDDYPRVKEEMGRFFAERSQFDVAYRVVRRDGTIAHWVDVGKGLWDEHGVMVRWVGAVNDVTSRKKAEEALAAAEFTYRCLVEQSLVGIYIIQDWRFAYVNPRFAEICGYTQREMLDFASVLEFVTPADRETARESIRKRIGGEIQTARYEFRGLRRDGRDFQAEVTGSRIDFRGKPAIIGIMIDITERKRSEWEGGALSAFTLSLSGADTLDKVARIVHDTADNLWDWDAFLLALREPGAERFEGLLAVDTHEGKREFFTETFFEDPDRTRLGKFWDGETVLVNRDPQTPSPYESFGVRDRRSACLIHAPIRVGARAVGLLSIQSYRRGQFDERDARLVQRLADALGPALERCRTEAERTRLAAAIEQSTEAVNICDAQWRAVYVNPAWERMTGFSRDEVLGRHPRDLLKPVNEDAEQQAVIAETLALNLPWSGQWKSRRKDGTEFDERVTLSPLQDTSGRVTHFLAVRRDITQEIQLQAQIRQSQKMEAVGILAGGVAHDFNNVLQIIVGYAQLLVRRLAPEDPIRAELDGINRAAKRGAGLTRQLLAFSRKQVIQPRLVNLNTVVMNMERMLRRIIGEDIEMVTSLAPTLGLVRADVAQMEQVLMNLAVNARDAMPRGGRLFVETENLLFDPANPAPVPGMAEGAYVRLIVADTGMGMDAATLDRIFEPFFTTKPAGKGTGLGLSTVYGTVRQSNGFVHAVSEPGHGAMFAVFLPVAQGLSERIPETPTSGIISVGTETVLLVEDEDEVRSIIRNILEALGYTVLEAANGHDALRLAGTHTRPIHLVLTDVVMPEMSGHELVGLLAASHPETRYLYMSGYTDNPVVLEAVASPETPFLQKPVSPTALARKVREVLNSPGPA